MNYYNEHDPKAAAWLRSLIAARLIPPGHVDGRSIADVKPEDLDGFVQCHFFAGIGGWSLALQLAGWPEDRPVWTGSCPCQPFSSAGKQMGRKDPRHLWPTWRRLINRCRPATVFGEQVASAPGREWFAGVRSNLETMGYAVGCADLCAAGVGAPHIRQRLFWVADADGRITGDGNLQPSREHGQQPENGGLGRVADPTSVRCAQHECQSRGRCDAGPCHTAECGADRGLGDADGTGQREHSGAVAVSTELSASELRGNTWDSFDILHCTDGKARRIEPGTFPLAHGVPARVVRLRGYGNAIVPQLASEFISAFLDI